MPRRNKEKRKTDSWLIHIFLAPAHAGGAILVGDDEGVSNFEQSSFNRHPGYHQSELLASSNSVEAITTKQNASDVPAKSAWADNLTTSLPFARVDAQSARIFSQQIRLGLKNNLTPYSAVDALFAGTIGLVAIAVLGMSVAVMC